MTQGRWPTGIGTLAPAELPTMGKVTIYGCLLQFRKILGSGKFGHRRRRRFWRCGSGGYNEGNPDLRRQGASVHDGWRTRRRRGRGDGPAIPPTGRG